MFLCHREQSEVKKNPQRETQEALVMTAGASSPSSDGADAEHTPPFTEKNGVKKKRKRNAQTELWRTRRCVAYNTIQSRLLSAECAQMP